MPTKEVTSSSVETGNNKFLDFCTLNSKKFLIATVIVAGAALAAAGGLWSFYKNYNGNVLAVVGKEEIRRMDLNKGLYSLDSSIDVNNPATAKDKKLVKQVLDELIDESIIRQEAEKKGIKLDQNKVNEVIREKFSDYDLKTDLEKEIIKKNTEDALLVDLLKEKVLSYSNGKFLLFRFDTFQSGDRRNLTRYNSDKIYALNLANDLYRKLNSKELTFEQARDILEKDETIGKPVQEKEGITGQLYGLLNKEVYDWGLGIIGDEQFKKLVSSVKAGEISQPSVLKVSAFETDPSQSTLEDGIYAVVVVDSKVNGEADTYQDWISAKREEYKNISLAFKIFETKKVYAAEGSCGGGLTYSGSNFPAALYIQSTFVDENNGEHADSNSKFTVNSSSGATFSWGGNSHSCTNSSVVSLNTSPQSFIDGADFWTNASGWIRLGYNACGGNGYALLCSCSSNYFVNASFGHSNGEGEGGHWSKATFYQPNGTTGTWTSPPSTIDPFTFSQIANGGTAGFHYYYQGNHSPRPSHVNPPSSWSTTLDRGTTTANINFQGKATDADGDAVRLRMAYKKTTDTGWTYIPSTGETTNVGQNTNYDFGSRSLSAGTYQWRIWAIDEHGKSNPAVNGNIAEYAGDWYFTINPPSSTTATLNVRIEPVNGVTPATPGGARTFDTTNTGQSGRATYSNVQAGYTFTGWTSEPSAPTICLPNSGDITFGVGSTQTVTCTAHFTRVTYTITPSVDAGCTISPSTNQTVNAGANSAAFNGSAQTNYRFDGFSIDGAAPIGTNPYTFTNVQANHSIRARCTYVTPNTAPSITLNYPVNHNPANPVNNETNGVYPSGIVNLSATISDSDNDMVDLRVLYMREGDATWTVACGFGAVPANHTQPYTRDCATASLTDGNYWWAAQGRDEHNAVASTPARLLKILTPPPAPAATLSCAIYPQGGGQAPLVVRAAYTVTNPNGTNISVNMDDGTATFTKAGVSGEFYYTYNEAGSYDVIFTYAGVNHTCTPTVTVTNPNDGSGGEVSP